MSRGAGRVPAEGSAEAAAVPVATPDALDDDGRFVAVGGVLLSHEEYVAELAPIWAVFRPEDHPEAFDEADEPGPAAAGTGDGR